MSQQQPTLGDIELQYHESKTQTDAIIGTLIREYKGQIIRLNQELRAVTIENSNLKAKYEPKKDEKTKSNN